MGGYLSGDTLLGFEVRDSMHAVATLAMEGDEVGNGSWIPSKNFGFYHKNISSSPER